MPKTLTKVLKFDAWFDKHTWWNENTAYDELLPVWNRLVEVLDGDVNEVEHLMDAIIYVIRNEYGE